MKEIMVLLFLVLFFIYYFYPEKDISYGSAKWGKYRKKQKKQEREEKGSIILGESIGFFPKPMVLSRQDALQHGLILGGSGTGKSRSFFLPNARRLAGTSVIVTDPKGELWEHTSGFHEEAIRFAPAEPNRSQCFNWIPLCREPRIAHLCARAIVESGNTEHTEQVWLDLEMCFLAGLFAHVATVSEPTPLTVYTLFTCQSPDDLIRQMQESASEMAQDQAGIFLHASEKMRASVMPVIAARLSFLQDEAIARFTSSDILAPDFSRLCKVPTAVYFCLHERDMDRLRPLTSLFFSLLLSEISQDTDMDTVPVTLLLDEFANIGKIPSFDTTISVARGRSIALFLGIQSFSQLEDRYGKAKAQVIISNCSTKITLHGLDVATSEYISKGLGEETISSTRVSRNWFMGMLPASKETLSTGAHGRPLLTPDEVRRLPKDISVAIISNEYPYKIKKQIYSDPPNDKMVLDFLGKAQRLTLPQGQAQRAKLLLLGNKGTLPKFQVPFPKI
jgi:type IV secretion system protein VirD4